MATKKVLVTLCSCSALLSTPIKADIQFNGFASIVAGKDLDDDITFGVVEHDSDISFKQDTKFALQATADLDQGLSATAQIMARGQDDFDATFEWAYLSYELNDSNTLRAGKLRLPFYNYSDYLDVGYAFPWLRPPDAMYNLLFSTFEGVSWLNTTELGDWDVSSQVFFGNTSQEFFRRSNPTQGSVDWAGINSQFSNGDWSLYGSYVRISDADIPIVENIYGNLRSNSSLNAAQQGQLNLFTALENAQQLGNLSMNGDDGYFAALGAGFNNGTLSLMAEYSEYDVEDSLLSTNKGWYVHAGYSIGKFMPHITYMKRSTDLDEGEINGNFDAPLQQGATAVTRGQFVEYTGIVLGLRYDFHPRAALKIDFLSFDDIFDAPNRAGTADNKVSNNEITFGIDLVF